MHPVKDLIKLLYFHAKKETPMTTVNRIMSWIVTAPYLGWHTYKLHDLLSYKNEFQFIVQNVMGSKMLLDIRDTGISRDLLTSNYREPGLTGWWQKNVKPGTVEFDIGANIGYYALQTAQLVGKEQKVYAIEPVPENFDLLSENVRLNNYKNVELFNIAIGDHNGKCEMYWSGMRNYATLISQSWRSYSEKFTVPLKTIDQFIKDVGVEPDILRMDTEGSELAILTGAKKLLSSDKPLKLAIEVHFELLKEKNAKTLLDMLKKYNFKVEASYYEPHPAVQEHKIGMKLLSHFTRGFGIETGYNNLTLEDFYNRKFMKAQLEGIEMILVRE